MLEKIIFKKRRAPFRLRKLLKPFRARAIFRSIFEITKNPEKRDFVTTWDAYLFQNLACLFDHYRGLFIVSCFSFANEIRTI